MRVHVRDRISRLFSNGFCSSPESKVFPRSLFAISDTLCDKFGRTRGYVRNRYVVDIPGVSSLCAIKGNRNEIHERSILGNENDVFGKNLEMHSHDLLRKTF